MPVPNSTPVYFSKIREEGGKTSWRNPNYPTVENSEKYNISTAWMDARDENNQIGAALSNDNFSIESNMPGWDTWNRSSVSSFWIRQYNTERGIRLFWRANNDCYRSAFAIYRATNITDVQNQNPGSLIAITRFGNEWGDSNGLYDYCRVDVNGEQNPEKRLVGIENIDEDTFSWLDNTIHGDYESTPPDTGYVPDPTAITSSGKSVLYSYLDISPQAQSSGSSYYYYSIVPIDGREFHTLSDSINPTSYGITNNPTNISQYNQGNLYIASPNEPGDSDAVAPDGNGLRLFNDMGFPDITSIGETTVTIGFPQIYYIYLGVTQNGGTGLYYDYQMGHNTSVPNFSGFNESSSRGEITVSGLQEDTKYTIYYTESETSPVEIKYVTTDWSGKPANKTYMPNWGTIDEIVNVSVTEIGSSQDPDYVFSFDVNTSSTDGDYIQVVSDVGGSERDSTNSADTNNPSFSITINKQTLDSRTEKDVVFYIYHASNSSIGPREGYRIYFDSFDTYNQGDYILINN